MILKLVEDYERPVIELDGIKKTYERSFLKIMVPYVYIEEFVDIVSL